MKIKHTPLSYDLIGKVIVIQEIPLTDDGHSVETEKMRKLVGILDSFVIDFECRVAPSISFRNGGTHSLYIKKNQVEVFSVDKHGGMILHGYFETE